MRRHVDAAVVAEGGTLDVLLDVLPAVPVAVAELVLDDDPMVALLSTKLPRASFARQPVSVMSLLVASLRELLALWSGLF